jgi:glucosamine--fructose-6-phosphate aminotransferase (isomerizing)
VERAVAATKTYTCQLAAAFLLSIEVSKSIGNNLSDLESKLLSLPNDIANEIEIADESSRKIVSILVKRPVGFILGTGPNYPTALEGALKLRETSNLFIQAFAGREFLHGPIQLISRDTPVIILEPEKMPVVTERIMGYGAPLITLGKEADLLVKYEGPEEFYPIPYIIPLQFLALHVSLARGLNPDKPEKLGKVVR